jgi:hypothetical protein
LTDENDEAFEEIADLTLKEYKKYKDKGSEEYKEYRRALVIGLQEAYPGKSMVEISDIIKTSGCRILTSSPDPNGKEGYKWDVTYCGAPIRFETARQRRMKEIAEWPKDCAKAKKEEDLIEHYAYKILHETPWYELSFEENDEIDSEVERLSIEASDALLKEINDEAHPPEHMTKKEQQALIKETKRRAKERVRENQQNLILRRNTPTAILYKRANKLYYMCQCTGESLRNGELCEICKLTKGVESYMMSLFKEAAREFKK